MAGMPKIIKTFLATMLMLTMVCSTAFASVMSAPTEIMLQRTLIQESKSDNTELKLYKNHSKEQIPFQMTNMFPGDAETRAYLLEVSYRGTVTVHFEVNVRPGYEKLAEVLMCSVALKTTGEQLYDGLMKDIPESFEHPLVSGSKTTDALEYEITVSLPTSVGNEYMNLELFADFIWWAEEETAPDDGGDDDDDSDRPEKPDRPTQTPGHDIITDQTTAGGSEEPFLPGELVKPPKTGDISLIPVVAVAIGCVALLVLLLGRRRKEDAEYEK